MVVLNLDNLIQEVRDDGDFHNETYITNAQIARKLNKHYKTLYKVYCDADLGFFIRTFSDVSLLTLKAIDLPQNFYKLASLDKRTTTGWVPVQKINYSGREAYETLDFEGENYLEHLKFYFEDESIRILPEDQTGGVYRFRYYPEAPELGTGDAKLYQEHTDYLTYMTIAELKMKSEDSWQEYKVRANEVMMTVRRQLIERSMDIPETVADVYLQGQSDDLYYDTFINSFISADRDFQPQLIVSEEETFFDPLDFFFEFDPIPVQSLGPRSGVRGIVNRSFERFDSLSVQVRDGLDDRVLYTENLTESQTFNVILDDGQIFDDFKNYRCDVDGVIEDPVSDRLETIVKDFHVTHKVKPYNKSDLILSPVPVSNPAPGHLNPFGVSYPPLPGEQGEHREITADISGTQDPRSAVFDTATGERRHIQWIGIYETEDPRSTPERPLPTRKFFSIIFNRRNRLDTIAVSDFKVYLETGELLEFDLTANNTVSGGSPIVIIEKAVQINDTDYEKLRESATWNIYFEPKLPWYLGQTFGEREYVDGAIDTSRRRVKVGVGFHTDAEMKPLDSFDREITELVGDRLATNLNVSARNSHQIFFPLANSPLQRKIVFGLKDIEGKELSQFSCVNRITFFSIDEDSRGEVVDMHIVDTDRIRQFNVDGCKVLVTPYQVDVPTNFRVCVPRLYTQLSERTEGNIQVEFRDVNDQVLTARQIKYGYESLIENYYLTDNPDITQVSFTVTDRSTTSDDIGFINTSIYVAYYKKNTNDLTLVRMFREFQFHSLQDIDTQRPVMVGIA